MNVNTKCFNRGVPTIFSTHTERRNNKKVLQNRTTRNFSLRIGERRVLKWIIKKQEVDEGWGKEGGGRETAFIWLEMRSSAAITENDDELAQAIPTICTYN